MAVEAGVDRIVISNHGARQLDHSPATISVLEEIVHVVGGRIPVLIDGGTDVFKALALGAQAILDAAREAYSSLILVGDNITILAAITKPYMSSSPHTAPRGRK